MQNTAGFTWNSITCVPTLLRRFGLGPLVITAHTKKGLESGRPKAVGPEMSRSPGPHHRYRHAPVEAS